MIGLRVCVRVRLCSPICRSCNSNEFGVLRFGSTFTVWSFCSASAQEVSVSLIRSTAFSFVCAYIEICKQNNNIINLNIILRSCTKSDSETYLQVSVCVCVCFRFEEIKT